VTDAIRVGTPLECYFNDPQEGWNAMRRVERLSLDAFPNVIFSDPRVKWADMTGDGMQDIVLAHQMPLEAQAKLLRVLEDGQVERVGGTRAITVDVRTIAATNADLVAAIGEGRFRPDLFYRLHVFPIVIPALRQYFSERYSAKLKRPPLELSAASIKHLCHYPWPGNPRATKRHQARRHFIPVSDR
jgi:hypothetical protein